jgi:AcrR family transcriptional regulator
MPKVVDHDEYRKALLNQCLELFSDQGYDAITMRQLAQALRVSTGTLYHYFPSKEALFIQLVQELSRQDIQRFLAQAPLLPTVAERFQAMSEYVLDYLNHFMQQELLWIEFFQYTRRLQQPPPEILQKAGQTTQKAIGNYLQIDNETILEFIAVFLDGLLIQPIYGRHDRAWFQQQLDCLNVAVVQLLAIASD